MYPSPPYEPEISDIANHQTPNQRVRKPKKEATPKYYLEQMGVRMSDQEYKKMCAKGGYSMPVEQITRVRTAAQRLTDANSAPPLRPLCGCLWETPGIAFLVGDTGVGKSVLAVHIAHLISSDKAELLDLRCDGKQRVLYYDFELSDRQFQKRFADFPFTEYFLTGDTDPVASESEEFTIEHICNDLDRTGANILILDNITALALKTTADADVSIGIMKGLKRLQQERGVSSLIIAHTPKIPAGVPLSINHLAGSKHLSNFADSVFFIGRSVQDSSTRYIKQVKNRTDEELQGVIVCELNDEAGYLDFSLVGYDEEVNHLAAAEGKSNAPRKALLPDVLAALPASLVQPLSAGQLELHLATYFGTETRTIRKRLKDIIDTNAQSTSINGQVYTLTKEKRGRENWYSLTPLLVSA